MHTTDALLYVDHPSRGQNVMLKIVKVLIRHGDRVMESYAVLDDGSERTILL